MYGAGGGECGDEDIKSIDQHYESFPPLGEIGSMCYDLGIKENTRRTVYKDDAWAYYHELKAMVEAKQRKTA